MGGYESRGRAGTGRVVGRALGGGARVEAGRALGVDASGNAPGVVAVDTLLGGDDDDGGGGGGDE